MSDFRQSKIIFEYILVSSSSNTGKTHYDSYWTPRENGFKQLIELSSVN
jgi:hypothetical protein